MIAPKRERQSLHGPKTVSVSSFYIYHQFQPLVQPWIEEPRMTEAIVSRRLETQAILGVTLIHQKCFSELEIRLITLYMQGRMG